jgi:hypothetical protein
MNRDVRRIIGVGHGPLEGHTLVILEGPHNHSLITDLSLPDAQQVPSNPSRHVDEVT